MNKLEDWVFTVTEATSVDVSQIPTYIPEKHRNSLIQYHPKEDSAAISTAAFTNGSGNKVIKFVFPEPHDGWWDTTIDLLSTLEYSLAPDDVPLIVARHSDGSPLGSIDFNWSLHFAGISKEGDDKVSTLQWRHRGIGEFVTTQW